MIRNCAIQYCLFIGFLGLLLVGCAQDFTPKPKAYPRMVFPEKAYAHFENEGCPFSFELPVYAKVDTEPHLRKKNENDHCWMDIVFDTLNARFHVSYKDIGDKVKLTTLLEDAHKLTSKHVKRAEYIDQRPIATEAGIYGLFSDVGGDAASSMQFFLTDSVQHYLYGSLYFATTPNYDSIQPAIKFLKEDMLHMIESFEWKEDYGATVSR